MIDFNRDKIKLEENGFSIVEGVFQQEELNKIIHFIEHHNFDFSERQLLNRFPELQNIIFESKSFKKLYSTICDKNYFLSKAIYFNKPSKSNWFVSYHQDLSISVKNKIEKEGYNSWTNKKGQLGVIPPLSILENSVTFRIHLDKADKTNGCLKVISKSHKKGIIRVDTNFDANNQGSEVTCNIKKGGVMLMKPLLLHASQKSISESDRRVIHLEFCNQEIPMEWLEKKVI
ncbi:phytanoyl-CoA dioxygenase family protein [Polaribacter cellanae]|uniref:Phytanoyl-CoA dioxygenase family protein n=1 Tax=Polaribacter cellanae TaxID=2818493 RepID=A0A975CTL3_9FLAO|nr:phytanoyl-CoA dioxygenase family protein [Polaribacter cellanae]QTE23862.1 phytanoyl-CoA dioxygenase family protein [Polaribacter cellanae]